MVPVFPEKNANGNRRRNRSDDRAECASQNRDDRSSHLDDGYDALYDDKTQLNNGDYRLDYRNDSHDDADDSRDAFYSSNDGHHAHGNSADGFADVRPCFFVNFALCQIVEELSDSRSHLIDFRLNRIKSGSNGREDALENRNHDISDAFCYVADGFLDFLPCADDVFSQLVAVNTSSFEHGSQQAVIAPHKGDEIIDSQSKHQEDSEEEQCLPRSQIQGPCQLYESVDNRSDFLRIHHSKHRRQSSRNDRDYSLRAAQLIGKVRELLEEISNHREPTSTVTQYFLVCWQKKLTDDGLYFFQLCLNTFCGAFVRLKAALAVADCIWTLGKNRLIVDLHLRELVQLIIGSAQAKRSHRLCSGRVVQDCAQSFCCLRFAHDGLRHVVDGSRFIQISERCQIKGERGHLLR